MHREQLSLPSARVCVSAGSEHRLDQANHHRPAPGRLRAAIVECQLAATMVLELAGGSCCCCSSCTEAGHHSRGEGAKGQGRGSAGGHAAIRRRFDHPPPPAAGPRRPVREAIAELASGQLEPTWPTDANPRPHLDHSCRVVAMPPHPRPGVMPRRTRQGVVGHGPNQPGSGERACLQLPAKGSPARPRNQQRRLDPPRKDGVERGNPA